MEEIIFELRLEMVQARRLERRTWLAVRARASRACSYLIARVRYSRAPWKNSLLNLKLRCPWNGKIQGQLCEISPLLDFCFFLCFFPLPK